MEQDSRETLEVYDGFSDEINNTYEEYLNYLINGGGYQEDGSDHLKYAPMPDDLAFKIMHIRDTLYRGKNKNETLSNLLSLIDTLATEWTRGQRCGVCGKAAYYMTEEQIKDCHENC